MNSEFLSNLNWLHILVATVAYFMLGAIWYSFLFQKKWIEYQNIDMSNPDAKKGAGALMAMSFVGFFVICTGLAILALKMDLTGGAASGVKLGLTTGICFSAAAISITYLYVKKPVGLHFIDGLYHVVGQVIAAVILCAWK
jgi:hypothetical protein